MRLASARSLGTVMPAARTAIELSLTVFISQKTGWECGVSAATSNDPIWTSTAVTMTTSNAPAANTTINKRLVLWETIKLVLT
jgi:hypothetical protein